MAISSSTVLGFVGKFSKTVWAEKDLISSRVSDVEISYSEKSLEEESANLCS